jgi:hypothetical protein
MHIYINPKRGFLKILNFEQAWHFCSKQAVQKQWSLVQQLCIIKGMSKLASPLFSNLSCLFLMVWVVCKQRECINSYESKTDVVVTHNFFIHFNDFEFKLLLQHFREETQ